MNAVSVEVSLGDVVEVVSGLVDPNADPYSEWPHVGGENIESNTGNLRNLRKSKELSLISGKYAFGTEHVLYSKIRPYLNKVVVPNFEGVCSADIYPLKPLQRRMTREFLARVLRSQELLDYALKHSTRTNIPKVNRKTLLAYRFLLPPLAEQKRIAGILDAADALRAKRRESLAQLDTLLQCTFLDMFGDPVASGWEMTTVEEVARPEKGSIRTGPFGSQLLHSEFVDAGIRVLGIDNAVKNEFRWGEPRFVTEQKYKKLRRYTVKPGDVLITIMGTCGRCAVVPDSIGVAINTKHLCCITLDHEKCLPLFMHAYFLRHPAARRYLEGNAKGAIMSGLNMGVVKRMPIPLAPLGMQRQFAKMVADIRQQRARMRAHLAELDNLFASLQSRAFRGEL